MLPAELFGVRIDHSKNGTTTVDDDIDPAVASSQIADAYRDYARNAEWVDGDAILYVGPDIDVRKVAPWDRDVFAKIVIELSLRGGNATIATLDPADTDGFTAALGQWVHNALFR